MCKKWRELLPFYVAGVLSAAEGAAVEAHLGDCEACRVAVEEWQSLAVVVRAESATRVPPLPPLSPLVRASLRRRPTLAQALRSAADLTWAQRVVLIQKGLLPAVLLAVLLSVLATLCLRDGWPVALPMLALVPLAAALAVVFLYGPETDPAFEIVTPAPTPPGTLLLARLTLTLGLVGVLATLGSLVLSAAGAVALGPLIGAWLGPLLLLSALATVLALLWRPLTAAGVTLFLWATVVILLGAEVGGQPLIQTSLRPLLQPGWPLFLAQSATAGLLWSLGWLFLARDGLLARKLEAG